MAAHLPIVYMTYSPALFLALLAVSSCTSVDRPPLNSPVAKQALAATPVIRRTYWPLDHAIEQHDTLLAGREHYQVRVITTCLNDSAVVNPSTENGEPLLDVSHNYQSDLTVARGQQPWRHARLTKDFFQDNPVAQKLGPSQEWRLSNTEFVRHQPGQFVFYTRVGIPDSDVFVEAEVALVSPDKLRLISVHQPVQKE
jgi:hypothetical protein